MNKRLAPVLLSVGLLGLVGGVVAANAFTPAQKPAKVEFVQPASVQSTPEPVATTNTVKAEVPVAPAKPAVKPSVAVKSVKAKTPAKAPQSKVKKMSEQPQDPPSPPPGVTDWRNVNPPPPPPPGAPTP